MATNEADTITAQAATTIDAPAQDVWNVLTDPQRIGKYFMGATVDTDWQVGHPITFTGEWKGQQYQDKGEILACTPTSELAFSHWSPLAGTEDVPDNYHVVRITLVDRGDSTAVTLAQSNLNGAVTDDDRAHRADFEKNWATVLDGLKADAEG